MRIIILIFCVAFFFNSTKAQNKKVENKAEVSSTFKKSQAEILQEEKEAKEKEDIKYEMKHKNQAWFRSMSKPDADYLAVKEAYDKYFACT